MHSRRNFIEGLAAGVAATALSSSRVLGANERIRLGIIGAGARGKELMRFALGCPNTEIVGAADVYTRRLEEARKLAPNAKTYLDYRHLLEDKSVDAVLIATRYPSSSGQFGSLPERMQSRKFCMCAFSGVLRRPTTSLPFGWFTFCGW